MTFDELIEVYRLTYLYQMLKQHKRNMGGWLSDQANIAYLKIKSRLLDMINDAIEKMIGTYDMWIDHHYDLYLQESDETIKNVCSSAEEAIWGLDSLEAYENAVEDFSANLSDAGADELNEKEKENVLWEVEKALKDDNEEKAGKIFSDFIWSEIYGEIDIHELAQKMAEEDPEYQNIVNHKDELEESWYGRGRYSDRKKPVLDDMLTQFHIGLHIAHHNGTMATHFMEYDAAFDTMGFLKELSQGLYVDEWDRELARIIGRSYDPEEEDSIFIDWSERGRIRNPGAIPAPECHIFIQE
jgi:hypothetical protein